MSRISWTLFTTASIVHFVKAISNAQRKKRRSTACWKIWMIVNTIDEIMMQKHCVYKTNSNNSSLYKTISMILIETTISRIFSDVHLQNNFSSIDQMLIKIRISIKISVMINSIRLNKAMIIKTISTIDKLFSTFRIKIDSQIKVDSQTSIFYQFRRHDCKLSINRRRSLNQASQIPIIRIRGNFFDQNLISLAQTTSVDLIVHNRRIKQA